MNSLGSNQNIYGGDTIKVALFSFLTFWNKQLPKDLQVIIRGTTSNALIISQ